MTTNWDIINRFAEEAGKPGARLLRLGSARVMTGHHSGYGSGTEDTIFSYGRHFPMARIMPAGDEPRGWWLLNGDTYSVSTSRHQSDMRSAVKRTGLPVVIVPFSALHMAGTDIDSVEPVDVLPDRYTWEPRIRAEAPAAWEQENDTRYCRNWRQLDDGRWSYETSVHRLGESLIRASYSYTTRPEYTRHAGTALFLSGFDMNERPPLYFLAQLPDGAQPWTVAEAFEALKPDEVKDAEALGIEVLRQGDVFAIPTTWKTRDLPGPSMRMAQVLDVSHRVSELRYVAEHGITYGRGVLRHRPEQSWRKPEHKQVKLGDGRTWHQLVLNTVPAGRSWSVDGKID